MASKKSAESVKVVVRCRPMNEKEVAAGYERVVEMDSKRGIVYLSTPSSKKDEPPREFTFDSVYDWNSKQRDLYDETFSELVESVLNGYNGTIFAYGQTGTGKTFTMEGVRSDPELRGVIPNSFEHIFTHISRTQNQQFLVRASYLEIYQEIKDLLSKDHKKKLDLKERPDTGIYVKDLQSFVTKSVKEIEHVMNVGNQNRAVGATKMNEHSSRSHAIFLIYIECSEVGPDGEPHIRVGKLNMVDLAGSERQDKTGAEGDRLKEATKINLSLSALGNVISALVDGKSAHIPYRDSKLTRLLQDSLGGNARTVMVANMGPASYNYEETITTLRYANRAKNIKNKPKINEDPKDALLREFQEEIQRLRTQLQKKGGSGVSGGNNMKIKKKRRKMKPDGTEEEIEAEEDVEGTAENILKEQQAKLDLEKQMLLQNSSIVEEEKAKLIAEIDKRSSELNKEQQKAQAIEAKIKAMESKLLIGGKSIIDKTTEQEKALELRRKEILEQKKREREIAQRLEQQEENAMEIKENFTSLQQEVDVKTKKLKKLFAKLQTTKQEISDAQEDHIKERQVLATTLEELNRAIKLKTLIIENFIPLDDREKVKKRAYFDADSENWIMKPLTNHENVQQMAKRPVSAVGNKRPISEYARKAAVFGGNPRYKMENIIQMELDMPSRTTRDYEGPSVAPRIQAALDAALQNEDDLTLDASSSNTFNTKIKIKGKRGERPKTAKLVGPGRVYTTNENNEYPTARGLVKN